MHYTRWQLWRYRHRQAWEAWLILTPILLYYLIFSIAPVLLNISLSFTRWNGISGSPEWIGLANYGQYLRGQYPLIIFNTALFALVSLAVQTVVAFFIAVLLNQKVFARGLYRALWYVPTLTSAAIMAQVAVIFISPFDGILNNIMIAFTVWRGVGGAVVLFLAGLAGIHPELYEAARVDGSTGWELLRYITVPLLRPMILFVLVTGIIGGFQIFEAVLLISKGGPKGQTNVMLLQIYNDAFVNTNMGVASAGAVLMALILFWFSLTSIRMMRDPTPSVAHRGQRSDGLSALLWIGSLLFHSGSLYPKHLVPHPRFALSRKLHSPLPRPDTDSTLDHEHATPHWLVCVDTWRRGCPLWLCLCSVTILGTRYSIYDIAGLDDGPRHRLFCSNLCDDRTLAAGWWQ